MYNSCCFCYWIK